MSGGPTVDLDGNVVGFNSFGIDSSIESQQFNFVRPTAIINELMADVGVDNELGEVSENYRAGLDAYFAGDKDAAVESLQAVIDAQPTNAMAGDYLQKAKAMEEASSGSGGSSDGDSGFPCRAGRVRCRRRARARGGGRHAADEPPPQGRRWRRQPGLPGRPGARTGRWLGPSALDPGDSGGEHVGCDAGSSDGPGGTGDGAVHAFSAGEHAACTADGRNSDGGAGRLPAGGAGAAGAG